MENELLQLTVIAVVLSPITAALVQATKTATGLNAKLNTVASLIIGVALAGLWSLTFGHIDQIGPYLMAGLLSGLSASGLYDLTKKTEVK